MAGRDGTVTQTAVRLPEGLILLVKRYQSVRKLPSFNAALIELLETHPAIAHIVSGLYAVTGS